MERTSKADEYSRRLSCSAKPYVAKRSDLLPAPARRAKPAVPCPATRRR